MKNTSRIASTIKNMSVTIIYQLINVFAGAYIPYLILNNYGPDVHGTSSAINNIMSYVLIMNAGMNIASVQALYKPIAQKDYFKLNQIFNAIKKYYKKAGYIYTVIITMISFALPYFIDELNPTIIISMTLALGLQSILDCYLISTERILIQADQKLYLINIWSMLLRILRTIIQVILINLKSPIFVVLAIPAVVLFIQYILQKKFVKENYPFLNRKIPSDNAALSQRNSALVHQLSGLILNNTDTLLLTFWAGNMILVSVYTVYELVFNHIVSILNSIFSNSSVASFGNLIAEDNLVALRKNYNLFEYIFFNVVGLIYSVLVVVFLPFVELYTQDISGVDYSDQYLAILFVVSGLANNFRIPGNTLINAGGYFSATKWRSVLEATINLTISFVLFESFNSYGLVIGTICAFLYRTTDTIIYSNKHILKTGSKPSFIRVFKTLLVILTIALLFSNFDLIFVDTWVEWILLSSFVGILSVICLVVINLFFEFKYTLSIYKDFKGKVSSFLKK